MGVLRGVKFGQFLAVGLGAKTLNSIAPFFNVLSLALRTRAIGYVLKNYCVIAPRQQK